MKSFEYIAWPFVGISSIVFHALWPSTLIGRSLLAAFFSSVFIIFALPFIMGDGISNIFPIAFLMWFVLSFAIAMVIGLILRLFRVPSRPGNPHSRA